MQISKYTKNFAREVKKDNDPYYGSNNILLKFDTMGSLRVIKDVIKNINRYNSYQIAYFTKCLTEYISHIFHFHPPFYRQITTEMPGMLPTKKKQ